MLDYYDEAGKPRRKTFKNRPDAKPFLQKLQARISKLSSVIDGDELNVTIHRHSDWSNYLKLEPLTIRAIIEIIGKMWLTTATLTDAERGFLRKFAAAKDRGAFIGENFFDAALNCARH